MNGWAVVVAGGVVVGYGALSRRLSSTVFSGPMVFMLFGLAIGPLGLDLLDGAKDPEVTRALLESALVLLLFADAAGIRARDLRREEFLPLRLLAVGLPVTMALGWLVAWPLLPGLGVWELALVGIILAPTDAALGQQAFSNKRVPPLIRGGLTVESGLNDGLALPFFVLALAAAGEGQGYPGVAETFLRALLLSGAIGVAAALSGASLLRWSLARGWSSSDWRQFLVLVVPVIAYALCSMGAGSGFIGAWVSRPGLRHPPAPDTRRPWHSSPGLGPRAEHEVHRTPRPPARLAEFPRLRRGHPGTRTRAPDMADRRLRTAQPYHRPDTARRTRPGRYRPAPRLRCLYRLVRSARARFPRVRPARPGRAPARGNPAERGHRRDRGPEHHPPRSISSLPGQPLRRMVHQDTPRHAGPAGERTRAPRRPTLTRAAVFGGQDVGPLRGRDGAQRSATRPSCPIVVRSTRPKRSRAAKVQREHLRHHFEAVYHAIPGAVSQGGVPAAARIFRRVSWRIAVFLCVGARRHSVGEPPPEPGTRRSVTCAWPA